MTAEKYTKWVACWGNATSITDRKEATYAKDLSLRYPIEICFSGSKLRFHFSNLTGTESVRISNAFVAKKNSNTYKPIAITFGGKSEGEIPAGKEILSDEISFAVSAGESVEVSLYLKDFTQMNSGTLITGPLSKGSFCYGNFAESPSFPRDLSRSTNWFYFLNTVDILTEEKNFSLVCFGDSITAQDWPDYLKIRAKREGFNNVSIIRRAVSGTRILREYSCITYAAYGLKGQTRFPIEIETAGVKAVIIQHGINDIIHPVGVEVNPFRPMSDMPTVQDLIEGVEKFYLPLARKKGLSIWSGTLLPIFGWRTYNKDKDAVRKEFNAWLRTSPNFDGCIDFDKVLSDPQKTERFADGMDSGDHLHPSAKAYECMAEMIPEDLLK